MLEIGAIIHVSVTTDSMHPTIFVGQQVTIVRSSFDQVRVGDIIAYTKGRRRNVIVHRVVRKQQVRGIKSLSTKGDGMDTEDTYKVYETDFVGVVKI